MADDQFHHILTYACPVGVAFCQQLVTLEEVSSQLVLLQKQSERDELTGLYNHRYFRKCLSQEMERTQRSHQETVLIMVDLDFFKAVNDTWGHESGNIVLKETGTLILSNLRKLDIGCRYGGEEFALILPNTKLNLGIRVAERIREMRSSKPTTTVNGVEIKVTASLGLSVYDGYNYATQEEFIDSADKMLYKAKSAGRNRVEYQVSTISRQSEVSSDEKRALLD